MFAERFRTRNCILFSKRKVGLKWQRLPYIELAIDARLHHMLGLCLRCSEVALESGFCSCCEAVTSSFVLVDSSGVRKQIQLRIYTRLQEDPQFCASFKEHNVSFELFNNVFSGDDWESDGQDEYIADPASRVGDKICVRKRLVLRSADAIANFTALHQLNPAKHPGGYQASRRCLAPRKLLSCCLRCVLSGAARTRASPSWW